jgi:uncharacterized protein YacL
MPLAWIDYLIMVVYLVFVLGIGFVVDTSALIDGRFTGLLDNGLMDGRIVIPRSVLIELQALADSADARRRNSPNLPI